MIKNIFSRFLLICVMSCAFAPSVHSAAAAASLSTENPLDDVFPGLISIMFGTFTNNDGDAQDRERVERCANLLERIATNAAHKQLTDDLLLTLYEIQSRINPLNKNTTELFVKHLINFNFLDRLNKTLKTLSPDETPRLTTLLETVSKESTDEKEARITNVVYTCLLNHVFPLVREGFYKATGDKALIHSTLGKMAKDRRHDRIEIIISALRSLASFKDRAESTQALLTLYDIYDLLYAASKRGLGSSTGTALTPVIKFEKDPAGTILQCLNNHGGLLTVGALRAKESEAAETARNRAMNDLVLLPLTEGSFKDDTTTSGWYDHYLRPRTEAPVPPPPASPAAAAGGAGTSTPKPADAPVVEGPERITKRIDDALVTVEKKNDFEGEVADVQSDDGKTSDITIGSSVTYESLTHSNGTKEQSTIFRAKNAEGATPYELSFEGNPFGLRNLLETSAEAPTGTAAPTPEPSATEGAGIEWTDPHPLLVGTEYPGVYNPTLLPRVPRPAVAEAPVAAAPAPDPEPEPVDLVRARYDVLVKNYPHLGVLLEKCFNLPDNGEGDFQTLKDFFIECPLDDEGHNNDINRLDEGFRLLGMLKSSEAEKRGLKSEPDLREDSAVIAALLNPDALGSKFVQRLEKKLGAVLHETAPSAPTTADLDQASALRELLMGNTLSRVYISLPFYAGAEPFDIQKTNLTAYVTSVRDTYAAEPFIKATATSILTYYLPEIIDGSSQALADLLEEVTSNMSDSRFSKNNNLLGVLREVAAHCTMMIHSQPREAHKAVTALAPLPEGERTEPSEAAEIARIKAAQTASTAATATAVAATAAPARAPLAFPVAPTTLPLPPARGGAGTGDGGSDSDGDGRGGAGTGDGGTGTPPLTATAKGLPRERIAIEVPGFVPPPRRSGR